MAQQSQVIASTAAPPILHHLRPLLLDGGVSVFVGPSIGHILSNLLPGNLVRSPT